MIKVENLSKYYGKKRAIHKLNFELKKGEVVGLLGLNGSGKTTTIRILSSYLIPTEGEGYIDGINIFQNPLEVKKRIGYLPESPPLYKDLTVKEYLTFVARIKAIPQNKIAAEIAAATSQTGTSEQENQLIAHLSLGYRKRVGIAQAILGSPSVVIMDEPVSGLDPKQIVEMRNMIRSLSGKHTVLISSHILSELQKTCDRFLFLQEGNLVLDYSREKLDTEIARLSGLHIVLEGPSQETCAKTIQASLPEGTFSYQGDSTEGFAYLIQTNAEEAFRNTIIAELAKSQCNLHSLSKQEITLEDIFNRLN
ncbi:MAG: ABC transporter ATP-binding protein [Spirochaetota bacterium]